MCGRYVIALEGSALADALERRFGLEPMRWNLIPRWRPKPGTTPPSLFNARSATVAQKPSFRKLVPQQRCLVPAAGFYEWQRTENGQKQPYYFSLREKPLLAFAGIWDEWRDPEHPEARPQRSYAILTTGPNRLMEPIHDRMPVILKPEDEAEWLSPDVTDPVQLERLYQPYSADAMQRWPVSQAVNSPRQNKAELILNSQ